ncbi:MAG: sensor histidine kinase [Actinomycetota bacterium]
MLPLARAWLVAGIISFAIACSVACRPSLDGWGETARTAAPILMAAAMFSAFAAPVRLWSMRVQLTATLITTALWAVLMFDDTNWSILSFAIYALAFSIARMAGLALAAVASAVWALALVADEGAGWALIGPVAALAAGGVISLTIWGVGERNEQQAALIAELQATQDGLAVAEREKGVLEERARFAAEIHDTLAQGFTSIVLLSRAAQRNEQWRETMASIEQTAEENLQAARRLVAAIGPAELDDASLPDALRRQVVEAASGGIDADFSVVGEPRSLGGTANVAILRAAQEALLNVRTHAEATEVHATLTYLEDLVVLDVRDDGVGFRPGQTRDRGRLSGGQGLKALEHRAATLGGRLTIETREGGGTAISLQLPTTS